MSIGTAHVLKLMILPHFLKSIFFAASLASTIADIVLTQNIFDIVIEGDQLQDHADIIVQSMKDIITDISGEIKAIKVPEVPEYSDDNESDLEGPEEEMEGESSPSEMTNG
jgi:hypothetical protein